MSYIDALYKKDEDKIYVVERDLKKGRIFVEYDGDTLLEFLRGDRLLLACQPDSLVSSEPLVRFIGRKHP